MRVASIYIFTIVLLSSLPYAEAAMYSYVDQHGRMHFTNVPADPRYREVPGFEAIRGASAGGRYGSFIRTAAERYSLDPELIRAIIKVESDFNPYAVSEKGAMGLMQLMPATAAELGVFNPFDPWSNIDAGTRYLKRLITKFDGNIHLALAAYNAGPTVVAKNNAVPPYAETHKYIKKVFDRYQGKKQVAVSKPQKKNRIYRIVMDDGSIFFTNDENEARKASKL